MASSRRPLRHAIRPIVYEPPTTASFEASKVLAAHNARTQRQKIAPQTSRKSAVSGSPILTGGRTSGGMRISGGSFAPQSAVGFR